MLLETPLARPRVATGIPGLDDLLHGGMQRGKAMLCTGTAGSGKTVLGMQFLVLGGAAERECGVFVSCEESPASLVENAASFQWETREAVRSGRVTIVDGRPVDGTVTAGPFNLDGLTAVLQGYAKSGNVKRVVLDGLDALFATGRADETSAQESLRRLLDWLDESGLTTVITLKSVGPDNPFANYFSFAEFAASSVIALESRLFDRLQQRLLRVVKVRGGSFSAGEHQYLITGEGMRVSHNTIEKAPATYSSAFCSSGIDRLDRMLGGGFRSSSVTLISGLPGTAKTTIAVSFLNAGLTLGEPGLLVAFDESAEQIVHDVTSVGIDMDPHLASGLLQTASLNASAVIADEHYLYIEQLIERYRPKRLVIDPISALSKSGGQFVAALVTERLSNLVKSHGITTIFTAIATTSATDIETTVTSTSTVADTWLHLSYRVQRGERNRTLTIVKSRGVNHSNQLRELVLSDEGITLSDVYAIRGDVLLGTARLERKREEASEGARSEHESAQRMRLLELQKARLAAEIDAAHIEFEELSRQISSVTNEAARTALEFDEDSAERRRERRADPSNEVV